MMDWVARIILGLMLLLGGLCYTGLRILAAIDVDAPRDQGPLGGWGPVLAGLGFSILGVIVIVF
jgi:hypothetical protein